MDTPVATTEMDKGTDTLVLRFSHNIIEHLGLKLYQNRPTNVVAELVSNAWDAGAQHVWIGTHTIPLAGDARFVSVVDDGAGMSLQALAENYLVIGLAKDRSRPPAHCRYSMGRKGIGKLAPFGIAGQVDVCSIARDARDERKATWIRLRSADIVGCEATKAPAEVRAYHPQQICVDIGADEIPAEEDPTGEVRKFKDRIASGTGTLILLTDLTIHREVDPARIRRSMGRRFTVTLTRPDFKVEVDDHPVTEADALPNFEFRIPDSGTVSENLPSGLQVEYWVGFVTAADWPQDEAGVGVYAHGKIAQERPHLFGARGGELYSRYMYGVVIADWLDEFEEDIISTDRRSLDWDHPAASELREWGASKVRSWFSQYEAWRKTQARQVVRAHVDRKIASSELPRVGVEEREVISEMLAEVAPGLGKDESALDKVTSAVLRAYLHRPMREILKRVWDRLSSEEAANASAFLATVEELSTRAVPESMSLAVTFAQRAYALSLLHDLVHRGKEPDLQKLIERFPWIIDPAYEKLTANQTLATVVNKAATEGLISTRMPTGPVQINQKFKPDFVFLSDQDRSEILVVEIKSPQEELTIEHREQLHAYLVFMEQTYPQSKRSGILIGAGPQRLEIPYKDMRACYWTDVFIRSRRGHIELLAAMLKRSNPEEDDDRVAQIKEFGGDATWGLPHESPHFVRLEKA
jgi:hypothetical protein